MADAQVMAFDEDRRGAQADQRGGRHRPRAAPGHHGGAAEDLAELLAGQRGPVRFGEFAAHAVDGMRRAGQRAGRESQRAIPPTSSVITAATAKDRIDADIQLCGVNPMSRPNDVHAETHQDTYPGLMSW